MSYSNLFVELSLDDLPSVLIVVYAMLPNVCDGGESEEATRATRKEKEAAQSTELIMMQRLRDDPRILKRGES